MATPSARARRVAVYLFVVVAFVTLAWRNEVQDEKVNQLIAQKASSDYESCLVRKANVERLNALYEGLVQIEMRNPFRITSPDTVRSRIELFRHAQLAPPVCVRRP